MDGQHAVRTRHWGPDWGGRVFHGGVKRRDCGMMSAIQGPLPSLLPVLFFFFLFFLSFMFAAVGAKCLVLGEGSAGTQ